MSWKNFKELSTSLKASSASGMACQIYLEPHTAKLLATIIDEYESFMELHEQGRVVVLPEADEDFVFPTDDEIEKAFTLTPEESADIIAKQLP